MLSLEQEKRIGQLQTLCNRYGDFKVAIAGKKADGEMFWSKHRSVLECWESEQGIYFLAQANNRQILPCELVFDIDNNPTIEKMNKICDALERTESHYKAYHTGSKGYHIHCFDSDLFKFNLTKYKKILIGLFECDIMKSNNYSMIAIENCPHWKTGKNKTLLRQYPDEQTN